MNALRYGIRTTINWPILALIVTFALSTLCGNLYPKLTLPFMLESLAILALPFAFTQVILEPGSRRACALVIMITPLLSVGVGSFLQAMEIRPLFMHEWGGAYRLEGATGNPAAFAILAFAGFVVAVHELTRPGRPYAAPLAVLNLAMVILSGTRMAILACAVFLIGYLTVSERFRNLLRQHRRKTLLGAGIVAAVLFLCLPALQAHMFRSEGAEQTVGEESLNISSRDVIWRFYFDEFLLSPIVGRGIGSGFIAIADWVTWPRKTPHNEYLHLLTSGGIIGFGLCAAAIGFWFRQLLQVASSNDREYLLALPLAICTFAITDDVLVFSTGLGLYAYLGIAMTRPALAADAPRPLEADVGEPAASYDPERTW